MRQVMTIATAGQEFVGTWHFPMHAGPGQADLAFLFFNAGHLPRDGHAGITTRAAEVLAQMGHHALRFDLPGLGDSPGQLPDKTDDLFQMIHDGWFVESALALAGELRRRFEFRRLVLGGLCGAAGTSLLMAEREPDWVAGIIAIEIEFFYPVPELPLTPMQSLFSRAAWLRLLSGHSRYSHTIGSLGGPVLSAVGPLLLPSFADRPLCHAFRAAVRRGIPMLVLAAEGKRRATFYDQIKKALIRGNPPHLTDHMLAGTNHILTTGGAQAVALQHMQAWAVRHFPLRAGAQLDATPPNVPGGKLGPALQETG